ncbi:MAG: BamA/TamA family outer membrane protein [Pirellulales bacterium]|nr:BamA/TamA family outer membrane protein [Pirellulales bacterium]
MSRFTVTQRAIRRRVRLLLVFIGMASCGLESFAQESPPATARGGAAGEMVTEIRILGNDTIPTGKVSEHLTTRVGRPFERAVVQSDVRRLANLGWFIDVKPLYQTTPLGRIIIFKVVERPTIRYVTYLGNEVLSDKKLAKQTNLKVGGAVDPYAVEEGRRKILEHYQDRGFNKVQVVVFEGNKATDQGITYLINEGRSQKVWDVDFVGNDFVSDSRLSAIIKSKPPKFMVLKGYLNREQIDKDVDLLTEYYRSFGFFQARISRKLEPNAKGNWVNLTFVIYEGERYRIRSVRFMGNTKFEPTALASTAKLTAGDPFEQTVVARDALWLKELYGSHGYVFVDVRPETVFLEEPGDVDLIYHIDEGERFRIGKILVNIDGDNPHTRIQVALNRMSMRPGDVVDIREIKASERRLLQSGIFHADAATNIRPTITYQISESSGIDFVERPPVREASQGSGAPGIRGQSPLPTGPTVLPPADTESPLPNRKSDEIVFRGQSPDRQNRGQLSWWAQRKQERRIASAYEHIRGQSPGLGASNAYAELPAGGSQVAFGGRAVGATGPASKTLPALPTIRQAQYSDSIPPPAGSFGPTPGLSANPVPGYQVFPGGNLGLPGHPYPEQMVDLIFQGQETQTGRLMLGVGVNSDAGIIGNILIDERNFDWRRPPTSFEDFRNGTVFRGDSQRFRLEASPGSVVNRYVASFSEPYLLDSPLSLSLSGSFFDRRFRDWDEERAGGRVAVGWQWVERDVSANVSYRGENVTITNATAGVPELASVLGSNSLHGFKLTMINDTRDSAFLATQGHYLEASGEYVTGSFDYPRVMIDYRRYFLLRERPDHSGRHVLSISTNVGWQGNDAPIYEHFFAGGFSTLRGFDFRGASPVDLATGAEVGGEFQWLNSVQYLFPVTADETLHGVVFCDFGTVERNVTINDFRVAPGVGLRVSVPAMGPAPIALDFAWAANHAATDDRQVFSFSMGLQR